MGRGRPAASPVDGPRGRHPDRRRGDAGRSTYVLGRADATAGWVGRGPALAVRGESGTGRAGGNSSLWGGARAG